MRFLVVGIKTLLSLSGLFFLVFGYLCTLWTARNPKEIKNIFSGFVISFLYTFKILVLSFLVLLAVSFFVS